MEGTPNLETDYQNAGQLKQKKPLTTFQIELPEKQKVGKTAWRATKENEMKKEGTL